MLEGLTPTPKRILEVLLDGEPHAAADMMDLLWDEFGGRPNLQVHICNLRKHVQKHDLLILVKFICRRTHYQLCQVYRHQRPGKPASRRVRRLSPA